MLSSIEGVERLDPSYEGLLHLFFPVRFYAQQLCACFTRHRRVPFARTDYEPNYRADAVTVRKRHKQSRGLHSSL